MNRQFAGVIFLLVVAAGAALLFWSGQAPVTASVKPQTPQPPFPYSVEDIVVDVPVQNVLLAGTLTMPQGEGPHPAVILLSVAGPNDRDQSFAGHAGFHVLADHLTRAGIAVARFDDRNVGGSTGDYFATSWNELSDDALAAFASLQADPRIDADSIGFAGMSQGGAIGALAAAKNEDVAFLVLMSAPGLPGVEALTMQLEKTLSVSGVEGERADQYRALFTDFMDIVQSDPEDPATAERLRAFLNGPGGALIPPYRFLPRDADSLVDVLLGPWYRSNVNFDPQAVYSGVNVPVLALGGAKDFVAPPEYHLAGIEAILRDTPDSDVTTITFAGLNHLLQEAETGLPTEYASLENSFSPEALEAIEDWIAERLMRR